MVQTFWSLRIWIQREVRLNHGSERSKERLQVFGLAKIREISGEDSPGFNESVVAVSLKRRGLQLPRSRVPFGIDVVSWSGCWLTMLFQKKIVGGMRNGEGEESRWR